MEFQSGFTKKDILVAEKYLKKYTVMSKNYGKLLKCTANQIWEDFGQGLVCLAQKDHFCFLILFRARTNSTEVEPWKFQVEPKYEACLTFDEKVICITEISPEGRKPLLGIYFNSLEEKEEWKRVFDEKQLRRQPRQSFFTVKIDKQQSNTEQWSLKSGLSRTDTIQNPRKLSTNNSKNPRHHTITITSVPTFSPPPSDPLPPVDDSNVNNVIVTPFSQPESTSLTPLPSPPAEMKGIISFPTQNVQVPHLPQNNSTSTTQHHYTTYQRMGEQQNVSGLNQIMALPPHIYANSEIPPPSLPSSMPPLPPSQNQPYRFVLNQNQTIPLSTVIQQQPFPYYQQPSNMPFNPSGINMPIEVLPNLPTNNSTSIIQFPYNFQSGEQQHKNFSPIQMATSPQSVIENCTRAPSLPTSTPPLPPPPPPPGFLKDSGTTIIPASIPNHSNTVLTSLPNSNPSANKPPLAPKPKLPTTPNNTKLSETTMPKSLLGEIQNGFPLKPVPPKNEGEQPKASYSETNSKNLNPLNNGPINLEDALKKGIEKFNARHSKNNDKPKDDTVKDNFVAETLKDRKKKVCTIDSVDEKDSENDEDDGGNP